MCAARPRGHYAHLGARSKPARSTGERPGLRILARLCSVLEIKAELGIRLADAYAAGDRGLSGIAERDLRSSRDACASSTQRTADMARYVQARGLGGFDVRYGACSCGSDAGERLRAYLSGEIRPSRSSKSAPAVRRQAGLVRPPHTRAW